MNTVSEHISRLQRVSGTFLLIFNILIFSTPILVLMYWIFFNQLPIGLTDELLAVPINKPLSFAMLLCGFVVSLIPLSSALYGLFQLKKLFKLYAQGVVFSKHNANYISRFSYGLIAWVVAKLVFVTLISVVLTFANKAGERMIVLQVELSDIAMLICAAVIILISWVMKEATLINEEQRFTV